MKFYKNTFILLALLYCSANAFSQTAASRPLICYGTVTNPGPLCLIVFKNKLYAMESRLVDSLIRPKTIKSLRIEKEARAAAIYGSRAANGMVVIEIDDADTRREFDRLEPYLSKF